MDRPVRYGALAAMKTIVSEISPIVAARLAGMLPTKRALAVSSRPTKRWPVARFMSFFLTTKRRREALLLGDHLKPMNLNFGEQPLRIRRKFLSSFAVQMSFAGNFVVEG